MKSRTDFIESSLARMSLRQKVGQCFVIGFAGTILTPRILERIRNICPGGLRITTQCRIKTAYYDRATTSERFAHRVIRPPDGTVKDFRPDIPVPQCTHAEYSAMLAACKQEALHSGAGIPLYVSCDIEGDNQSDYDRGGLRFFPNVKGIGDTSNLSLAYSVAWAGARQIKNVGIDWVHSPDIDVNDNPENPEIGVRAYAGDPGTVSAFALEALRGYREAGIVATAKHFPGRGPATGDSHQGVTVIRNTREEMEKHLEPYRRLIAAGVPSVMVAHGSYPGLDPSGEISSLSHPIVTELLKQELGFQGAVITDEMAMGGIVERYDMGEACVKALQAGNDLLLFREESPLIEEVFETTLRAAESRALSEERLNDAVRRILGVKYDYGITGLAGIPDPARADEGARDRRVHQIARTAARQVVRLLRDQPGLLPLRKEQKILLIEQVHPLHRSVNSGDCHPGILWEAMLRQSSNVGVVETGVRLSEEDRQRVRSRLHEADVIVATHYYFLFHGHDDAFIQELAASGKPLVVVTNSPYPVTVKDEYRTILLSYGGTPEILDEVARRLFGA